MTANHRETGPGRQRQRGFNLIELLIVVGIVALVAAIAYPNYSQFIARSKRATATSVLLQVADRQQQFFMDNKRYAAQLTALGYASDALTINDDGSAVAAGSDDRTYVITLANVAANQFTAVATPQLGQARQDADCGSMTLTQAGAKGSSGGGDDCW